MQIKLPTITCMRCSWTWTPRKTDVRACPKCKSIYFDRPRTAREKIKRENLRPMREVIREE